jgi:hypothetical protein
MLLGKSKKLGDIGLEWDTPVSDNDYVALLVENINMVNKTPEALLDASKEVCLEVNAEKT